MRDGVAHQRKCHRVEAAVNRGLQALGGSCLVREQPLECPPQLRVILAGFFQQAGASSGVTLAGAMKQLLNLQPTLRVQSCTYALRMASYSQASAIRMSRRTVWTDTFSACAISSMVKPPK